MMGGIFLGDLKARNWRELIKPKSILIDEETHTSYYGKFVCEPLERGFGITVGNALRRILLSSLQGAAIVSVKFDNVVHEFSTIPGVLEDVTDVILNLKEVKLKLNDREEAVIHLSHDGEGTVRAGDIETNGRVEILNPEKHIASVNKEGRLKMEMTVKIGKGYVSMDTTKRADPSIGLIPIDAIFSPIKKARTLCGNPKIRPDAAGLVTACFRG
jgi:DNA-directed RNA polymerase subunit alpha